MGSRTKLWVERNQKFASYVQACDRLIQEVENIEVLIDELGSDPLNIMDIFRPVDGEVAQEVAQESEVATDQERWVRDKLEKIEAPEWWGQETKTEADTVVVPVTSPSEEGAADEETWQARRARERVERKNAQTRTWLYAELGKGPITTTEIKKRAKKAGISDYALLQARRTVNDIEISTVGYQGVRYWHLSGDKDKLPTASTVSRSQVENSTITANEQKILDFLQASDLTTAELIGKTGWTPEKVKVNTQKLSLRKLIRSDRKTLKWSRYD